MIEVEHRKSSGLLVPQLYEHCVSALMGDLAGGIKSFKKGMAEDDAVEARDDKPLEAEVESVGEKDKAAKG